jgi:hypothetical protein
VTSGALMVIPIPIAVRDDADAVTKRVALSEMAPPPKDCQAISTEIFRCPKTDPGLVAMAQGQPTSSMQYSLEAMELALRVFTALREKPSPIRQMWTDCTRWPMPAHANCPWTNSPVKSSKRL